MSALFKVPNRKQIYEELGFITIPIKAKSKFPACKWKNLNKDNFLDVPYSPISHNLAILTGEISQIFVIDIDKPKSNEIDALALIHEEVDPVINFSTLTSITGSGGIHLIYKYEDKLQQFNTSSRQFIKGDKFISLDIRSNGGYIICEPSIHVNSNKYYFDEDSPSSPQYMPDEMFAFLQKYSKSKEKSQTLSDKLQNTPSISKPISLIQDEKMDYVEKIFRNINIARWDNYDNWYKMLIILANLSNSNKDYRQLAEELSATSPKYDESETANIFELTWNCEKHEVTLGLGTALMWLKEDIGEKEFRNIIGRSEYIWYIRKQKLRNFRDYIKFYNKNISEPKAKEEIRNFIYDCIVYIANIKGQYYYLVKNLYKCNITSKNKITFEQVSNKDMKSNFKNIILKYTDAEDKIKHTNLWQILRKFQHNIMYTEEIFLPYTTKSNFIDIILNNAKQLNTYNTFSGFVNCEFATTDIDNDLLNPILHQIDVLCNFNEECSNYFIKWLAHIVQTPNIKTDIAILIKSEQGTGKSSFVNWFGNLVLDSQYYLSVNNIKKIIGRFNGIISNKILVVLEEAGIYENKYEIIDTLKDLVTGGTRVIERKCKENIEQDDYCNYIFLTNRDNVLRIDQSDRRYFCIEASNKYVGDTNYWDKLHSCYNNLEYAKNFYNYLMNLDLADFIIRNIPNTEIKKELMQRSIPIFVYFLLELYNKEFNNTDASEEVVIEEFNTNIVILCELYSEFMLQYPKMTILSNVDMGKTMKKYGFISNKRIRIRGIRTANYIISKSELEKIFDKYELEF